MNGLYIHVPFCVRKCLYCDFYSVTDLALADTYVAALIHEMELTASGQSHELRSVDTIYFGGGTPSVLSPRQLETIINCIHRLYRVQTQAEITLEVNPGTVVPDVLAEFRRLGINRLSIGVQSFDEAQLEFMGRIHSADESRALIRAAQNAGFSDLGLDLIYGLPNQNPEAWRSALSEALSFDPAHLSCYMLTWEDGTPLTRRMERGLFTPLDEDNSARLFEETLSFLESRGFVHYEISNFARSLAERSRHNQKYWNTEPYTGFGPSAHSFDPSENRRWWNVSNLNAYLDALAHGRLPVEDAEILDRSQQMTEALFLGLRKTDGINLNTFNTRFGCNFKTMFHTPLPPLIRDGLVVQEANRIFLTRKGLLLADRITSQFVDILG